MSAIFRVKRLKPPCLAVQACFSCQRKLAETQSVRQVREISVNLIGRKIQLKIGILFRTWNDSGCESFTELFAIWVNPSENFHGGGVPSILNRQIQTESSMRSFS